MSQKHWLPVTEIRPGKSLALCSGSAMMGASEQAEWLYDKPHAGQLRIAPILNHGHIL